MPVRPWLMIVAGVLFVFASSCSLDNATSTPAGLDVPTCPDNALCEDGFLLEGTFYGLICVRIRAEAVDDAVLVDSPPPYSEVRRIVGLSDAFLATRGDVPCEPTTPQEWWLAQREVSEAEIAEARSRLSAVTIP